MSGKIKLKIEPAKTSRASCRTCRQKIIKNEFRIGIPYLFTKPDGETITSHGFYHVACVPQDKIDIIMEFLDSSSTIDAEDKAKIFESLKKRKKEVIDSPQRTAATRKSFLEYSKSSRGACRICEKKIEKGILRVAEPSQVELDGGRKFFSHKFYHIRCYLESASDAKTIFQDLLQTSLQKKSISQEDADNLEQDFKDFLMANETAADVLSFITDKPIKLETLNKIANEKGVPFSSVKQAIEQGLLKGIFFEPSPGFIQKL
ncbi:MAG: hypothetical protein ACFFB5_04380 [Promethearchaeota archaeon]